jgi:hypothetical protein
MLLVSRTLFACKCSTNARRDDPDASDEARKVRWVRGGEEHLGLLSSDDHRPDQIDELRARLQRGEYWVLGLLGDRVASYTWLHTRDVIDFPYLPGCTFRVAVDVGYGYDAWTPPDLRGAGIRRRGFLEELHVLEQMGMGWEASFFVDSQIEGAQRSLGKVGIEVVPLWRVHLEHDRSLTIEQLAVGDESLSPVERASGVMLAACSRSTTSPSPASTSPRPSASTRTPWEAFSAMPSRDRRPNGTRRSTS